MSSCLLAGSLMLMLSGNGFTLDWTHSVEHTGWREDWLMGPHGLRLTRAAVKGSGAGMDPGEDAILQDGWWVWRPALPPQPQILLAASGATGAGWRICDPALPAAAPEHCVEIGAAAGQPVTLRPCPAPAG